MQKSISEKLEEFSSEISESYPGLLSKYPLELYVKEIQSYRECFRYDFINPKQEKKLNNMELEFSYQALVLYHKLLLGTLILDAQKNLISENTPQRIVNLYYEWFKRVEKDFSSQHDKSYHYKTISFLTDLAVCSQRAIPVGGAWLVEPKFITSKYNNPTFRTAAKMKPAAMPDRNKLRRNVGKFLLRLHLFKGIRLLKTISRKYSLYYVIHTVDRYLPGFTEQNMNQAYLNIVELLKANRKVYGIYRESWFLDPNLEKISPGLRFLWEVPVQNGAKLFCASSSELIISRALDKSPLRKRLNEEGKYKPMAYAYIWSRKDILKWAKGMALSEHVKGYL